MVNPAKWLDDCWASPSFIERTFKIGRNSLGDRSVKKRETDSGAQYCIADFYQKCGDLILKRLTTFIDPESGERTMDLKTQKLEQEVRKLKIANDVEARELVPREEVLPLYTSGMKLVAEKLDIIPLLIKMKAPDVPPAIMAIVMECVAEARNEAAKGELEI